MILILFFQFISTLCQASFNGLKRATSKGWVMCVLFGKSRKNLILFCSHDPYWELDRLSPIKTFGPRSSDSKKRRIIVRNHSFKRFASKNPLLLRLYHAASGPFSVHVDDRFIHYVRSRCCARKHNWRGRLECVHNFFCPFALFMNITLTLPGSSVKLVSS